MSTPATFKARGRWADLDTSARAGLVDRSSAVAPEVVERVDAIRTRVRTEGDAALVALAKELDGADIGAVLVPEAELKAAWDGLDATVRRAIETSRDVLARYHRATLPPAGRVDDAPGVSCTWRYDALDRAGIYVPGGRHPYPSTLLMTVVPAQAAGVTDLWIATPPTPTGHAHPTVLAAAHNLGIKHVVLAGGAQAVFALAYGTETVPACDVVVGPGNAYVQAAKRAIAGNRRIDSPAGPSEVLVLADADADPKRIAAELLAQAEHGPDTFCVALVPDDAMADAVAAACGRQADTLATNGVARTALADHGALLVVPDVADQIAAAAALAPEHLVVLRHDGPDIARSLRNAGCVFIGPHASVPIGDYAAGPSHVLPTGGAARAYHGLGVDTFMRRTNVVHLSKPLPTPVQNAVETLAAHEGLPAHAAAAVAAKKAPPKGGPPRGG